MRPSFPVDGHRAGVTPDQVAGEIGGEDCGNSRAGNSGDIGLFERIWVGKESYTPGNIRKSGVGELRDFRIGRIGADEQQQFMESDQLGGGGNLGLSKTAEQPRGIAGVS